MKKDLIIMQLDYIAAKARLLSEEIRTGRAGHDDIIDGVVDLKHAMSEVSTNADI